MLIFQPSHCLCTHTSHLPWPFFSFSFPILFTFCFCSTNFVAFPIAFVCLFVSTGFPFQNRKFANFVKSVLFCCCFQSFLFHLVFLILKPPHTLFSLHTCVHLLCLVFVIVLLSQCLCCLARAVCYFRHSARPFEIFCKIFHQKKTKTSFPFYFNSVSH